jgi:hypothetical protein
MSSKGGSAPQRRSGGSAPHRRELRSIDGGSAGGSAPQRRELRSINQRGVEDGGAVGLNTL